jgi:hypothetical protein
MMDEPLSGPGIIRRAAHESVARGWNVFPLLPIRQNGRCDCGRIDCAGKHPATVAWQKRVATSPEDLERDWDDRHGIRGIGLACGPASGVWAVDIDPEHGGMKTITRLQAKYRQLPLCAATRTGSGGYHLLFAWPDGPPIRNSAGQIGPGVDVRGDGGFIVLPPSPHASGDPYAWMRHPAKFPVLPAPAWILNLARERKGVQEPTGATLSLVEALKQPGTQEHPPIPAGRRNDMLVRFCGALRAMGLYEECIVECGHSFLRHQVEQEPAMDLQQEERSMRGVARRYPPKLNRPDRET